MFCIACRRAISENALFCPGCGKQLQRGRPLTITCQSCQASNPDDAIFCWNCGRRLRREDSAVDFILPAPPFAGGTQPPAGTVPKVQGIPQAGGAPMVHGTPSAFDAPSVARGTGHSLSQTPASSAGQPLSQPAASSAGASPSHSPPAPRPPVRTSHGTQSPRAPQPSVNTAQTSPASASRTKNASAGTRASRRILRPRVVLALVCVAVVVVAAATIGSLAVGAFNQPPKPTLSSGPAANPTQAPIVTPTQPLAPVSATDVPTPQPTLEPTQPPTPTPTDTPTPTATPSPPPASIPSVLQVTPENLTVLESGLSQPPCKPNESSYECTIVLANPSSNQNNIDWSVSASGPNCVAFYTLSSGTLAPGEQVNVPVDFTCNSGDTGTLIFSGASSSVTVQWTVTY